MDKSISKGDLVMVVRRTMCCNSDKSIGKIFTAGNHYTGLSRCPTCGSRNQTIGVWTSNGTVEHYFRLKRIDPGILSEDVPEAEKVDA